MADRILIEADADLWRRTGVAHPACSGACNQGRSPCPVPEACQVADDDHDTRRAFWWTYIVLLVALLSAIFWPAGTA